MNAATGSQAQPERHITGFGQYTLDLNCMPARVAYDLPILSPIDSGGQLTTGAAADD